MQNKVQLKEEELINSELVLTDIYPKTDTSSITDDASGQSLDVTLEHVWEAINNQLSRYVNSVNGRSGVVVLDPSDVGLSNVDNVSFNEIQQWVIERLEAEFFGHLIKTFESLSEVQSVVIDTNDRSYENCAFFARKGMQSDTLNQHDYRSYIGYFRWDPTLSAMTMSYKVINVVGATDRSLTYSTDEIDGGTLRVHIHPEETVLYLDNGTSDTNSGLRLNKNKLGGKLYTFFGAYYTGSINEYIMPTGNVGYPDDGNSGWYSGFLMAADGTGSRKARIYINDEDFGLHYLTDTISIPTFNDGDAIICHFNPYIKSATNELESDSKFKHAFMFRQPAIGYVSISGENTTIRFKSIAPYATWGITNLGNHKSSNGKFDDTELSLNFANTKDGSVASPINVMAEKNQYQFGNSTAPQYTQPNSAMSYIVSPSGHVKMYNEVENRKGGIFLQTDYSLCVMPYAQYGSYSMNSSENVENWAIVTPDQVTVPTANSHNGFLCSPTYLGINLFKGIMNGLGGKERYIPLSGLTVFNHNDSGTITPSRDKFYQQLGLDPEVDDLFFDPTETETFSWSGGVMVNVGEFLEIRAKQAPVDGSKMADEGKVNVRIGNGLKNDGHNRITIDCGDGVYINEDTGKLEATGGGGALSALKIDDVEGGSIFYNPAGTGSEEPTNVTFIHLGAGLYITTDEPDVTPPAVEDDDNPIPTPEVI